MADERHPSAKVGPAIIAHTLRGLDFPKNKDELVNYARHHGGEANPEVLDVLSRLPDRHYGSIFDVEQGVVRAE